ncbi:MAG: hypothetical protein JSR99_08285 [Proteobacteria bacterium]|nr:hypothetical protein [Pseudomonadota bacterium]
MTVSGNLDVLAAHTAASLRQLTTNVDALLNDLNAKLQALERAYIAGEEGIPAGDPTVFAKLEDGRLLAELMRESKARLAEVAKNMESRSALD